MSLFSEALDPPLLLTRLASSSNLSLPLVFPSVSAIDRVHRLGQKKPVRVFRFICSGTVEERLLTLQDAKKRMSSACLSVGGAASSSSKLTLDELRSFFM